MHAENETALDALPTEMVIPDLDDMDRRPTAELVDILVQAQGAAQRAALDAVPVIASVADAIAARLARGGRLFYAGAGTSGRLGVLDASECPPTFNTPPDMVVALLAGGATALRQAIENAEDDAAAGAARLRTEQFGPGDAIVGITASGRTPYVVGALRHAREAGGYTAAVVNNAGCVLTEIAHAVIELLTGPEVLAGSTRLCAGTAQKIALNTLSTAVMVRLGKTYGPYMVDMRATNAKLRRRALRMVTQITGAGEDAGAQALDATHGRVKPAVVMLLAGVDVAEAERRLDAAAGHVRDALGPSPTGA